MDPGSTQFRRALPFLSPWLIGFLTFTLLPVILSLYYSLCDYSLLQPPIYIGSENYRYILSDQVFWTGLRNTLAYAAISLPCGILISIGLAILLNQRVTGQSVYRTIIFLPSLVPIVASSMLWLWIFNAKLGLINGLLARIGIDGPGWLNTTQWAMPSLILMSFWGVGNSVVIYLAGLQDIPRELYEAADIDGASAWNRLLSVTLPTLSPVIFFNLIMGIIGSLQVFANAYIMTGGGPERATYFYTMYLYDNAFGYLKMGFASAMAWIQLLIVLLLTALAFWTSKRWVHYQGK
jgi:multiple sugar transport system permease protein